MKYWTEVTMKDHSDTILQVHLKRFENTNHQIDVIVFNDDENVIHMNGDLGNPQIEITFEELEELTKEIRNRKQNG